MMITKPDWVQPEDRAYFHQISPDCISKLAEVFTAINTGEIDIETAFRKYEQILSNEISDQKFLSFAITNLNELSSYIAKGKTDIRIHRNDVDEFWFDIDEI